MSYIYNNKIAYADTPNLDAFGRLRTSNITSLLEYKHIYNKLPLIVSEVVSGGTASSTFDYFNSQVVMSTSGASEYVIRQGKVRGIYQPGKGQIIEATFSNFQNEVNVIKRVGYFTTTTSAPYNSIYDGFVLESNGSANTISFQIWQSGTTIYSADSTSWLTTDYDVTNIDWSKSQLMYIDYQWLGVGRVRFGLVIDGVVKIFTTYTAANNINHVYMSSPNQPIRYEIRQVGASASGGTLNMICSQISMEGALNEISRTVGINAFNAQTISTAGTKYPLIGFRIASGGYWDGAVANLMGFNVVNTTNGTKYDFLLTLELNPTLSSTATWTGITNTPIEYAIGDVGGARTVTSSGYILANTLGAGSSTQADKFDFGNNIVKPGINIDGTPDEVWLCIVPATSNSQSIRSSMNIQFYI